MVSGPGRELSKIHWSLGPPAWFRSELSDIPPKANISPYSASHAVHSKESGSPPQLSQVTWWGPGNIWGNSASDGLGGNWAKVQEGRSPNLSQYHSVPFYLNGRRPNLRLSTALPYKLSFDKTPTLTLSFLFSFLFFCLFACLLACLLSSLSFFLCFSSFFFAF